MVRVVVVGNLVEDFEGGAWVPGGPALYAARMAHALHADVTLITNLPPGYDGAVLEGLALEASPVESACRYTNTYDSSGGRTQLLDAPGEPVAVRQPPAGMVDVLIAAPAFHELDALPTIDARVTMVTLQGVLRDVEGNRVVPSPNPAARGHRFIEPGAFACFSDEDTAEPAALARELASQRVTTVVTHGQQGVTLFEGQYERRVAALPARPIDPTGAGDCFAAAMAVRFAETGDLAAACAFGLAAGALATEGRGPAALPTRAQVERLASTASCLPGVSA